MFQLKRLDLQEETEEQTYVAKTLEELSSVLESNFTTLKLEETKEINLLRNLVVNTFGLLLCYSSAFPKKDDLDRERIHIITISNNPSSLKLSYYARWSAQEIYNHAGD